MDDSNLYKDIYEKELERKRDIVNQPVKKKRGSRAKK